MLLFNSAGEQLTQTTLKQVKIYDWVSLKKENGQEELLQVVAFDKEGNPLFADSFSSFVVNK